MHHQQQQKETITTLNCQGHLAQVVCAFSFSFFLLRSTLHHQRLPFVGSLFSGGGGCRCRDDDGEMVIIAESALLLLFPFCCCIFVSLKSVPKSDDSLLLQFCAHSSIFSLVCEVCRRPISRKEGKMKERTARNRGKCKRADEAELVESSLPVSLSSYWRTFSLAHLF